MDTLKSTKFKDNIQCSLNKFYAYYCICLLNFKIKSPADESTCCDEDFTWVKSDKQPRSLPAAAAPPNPSAKQPSTSATPSRETTPTAQSASSKPPPRPTGSLDRRRTSPQATSSSRQDRDGKSRSAHYLKERSLSSDGKETTPPSSQPGKGTSKENRREGKRDSELDSSIKAANHHLHHYGDGGASSGAYRRGSPGFWEPPPPPSMPYPHWEAPHYWNYHGASREELRMLDYHHRQRQQHDAYRYGSSGTLSSSHQELFPAGGNGNGGCCGGGGGGGGGGPGRYMPPPPPIGCCSHDPRVSGPIPWMTGSGQVRHFN